MEGVTQSISVRYQPSSAECQSATDSSLPVQATVQRVLSNSETYSCSQGAEHQLLLSILGQILFDIANSIPDVLTWAH
jgi:hypothetical protein